MMDLFIIFFVLFPFSPFYGFIFGLPITQKINLPCLFFFFIYYLFSLPFFVLNLGRKLGTIPNHAMRGKNKKNKKGARGGQTDWVHAPLKQRSHSFHSSKESSP